MACNSFAEILTNDTSGCAPFEFTIEALDEQNNGQYFWTWTPVDDNVQISYTNGSTADPTALVQLFTNNAPSDLIYTIIKKDIKKGTFNLGSGKSHSIKNVVDTVQRINKSKKPIKNQNILRKNDIKETKADIGKLYKILRWKPKWTLKQGISKILQK